jgi:transposase
MTTEMGDRLKALEREVRELRQANEILRKVECAPRIGQMGRFAIDRGRAF